MEYSPNLDGEIEELFQEGVAYKQQSISLAKEALGEHLTTGKVTVICPRCKENPRVWMTSKGERTYIECKCRYIHMGEINL